MDGIFMGYKIHCGGYYSGDMLVVDSQDLANAKTASVVHVRAFKESEVQPIKYDNAFVFPLAEGTLRQPPHEVQEWSVVPWAETERIHLAQMYLKWNIYDVKMINA